MSLSEEERNTVVNLQLEKARLFLQQADEMCKQQYWDIASNRYYYACYHAFRRSSSRTDSTAIPTMA